LKNRKTRILNFKFLNFSKIGFNCCHS